MTRATEMLTVGEAAGRVGVSPSLVYAWCGDGTLPHLCAGRAGKRGKILIASADLDELVAGLKAVGKPRPSPPLAHIRLD